MTKTARLAALAVGLTLAGDAAWAQADGTTATDTDVGNRKGSLSQKLNETSGVIHPQDNVDPGIHKEAPATGTMPVIPPPGTAGGRQDIEPK